jgi:hypothetical protein
LIVSFCQGTDTGTPTVTDTAGNTYVVVKVVANATYLNGWLAYCLSATANSANVTTWTSTGTNLQVASGVVYTVSSGTWTYDKSIGGTSAYATPLNASITTTGAGVIVGGFAEYELGATTWPTVTGLATISSLNGSGTGNGTNAGLIADTITTGAKTGFAMSIEDDSGGYGGYICGVVSSFVVA